MTKPTPSNRPAPLRDRTIALLAARGAYIRALRRASQAAQHLAVTAVECRRVQGADALMQTVTEHHIALGRLLDAAE